ARTHRFFRLLTIIALVLALVRIVQAGGPKYVAGASYFDQGTMGTPLSWSGGVISYYTDHGDLSSSFRGPNADALVADAFRQWTSVPTAAISAIHGGQLAEDVSGANVYGNPDGTITMPADILPSAIGTPVGIVYDEDGSVTNAFLGQGAGDASECFNNAVFGWIDNFGPDTHFSHALVIINGNCAQSPSQSTDVEYRLVRVLGRILGLDWSQVNDNIFTHNPRPTSDDYVGLPVMHASDPSNCIPITVCYPNPYQPEMDDQAALSRLYPVTEQNVSNFPGKQILSTTTVRIFGSVYFTNATGVAGQGMQGVNVIARWIDPSTGQPSRAYAAASVSGFLFAGNAGNIITGFNDPTGLPYNRFGSNDTSLEGFFDLGGLQLPGGVSSGQYQLTVEALDSMWSGMIGPYGPYQVEPSGTAQPILVNVSAGAEVEQDILMSGSAVQKTDLFPVTTYASPAAVPAAGDWTGSLSPYGTADYFWFSGQGNRTLSVLVTALDESGKPTESKAQPVIGMWALSDTGSSPAPANTSSAFNSAITGMTLLNAQLMQQAGFRIGITDLRGDGRPDYRYHARVLYGDAAQPNRVSVAGGTPFGLRGLGFEANTKVAVGNVNVAPLAAAANEILLLAPAHIDGVQNLTLSDPATGASSVMTGPLTYGAGPSDTIKLIAGSNPWTPLGGQAPNPIIVQALAADGATAVAGATVVFSSSLAASFAACSGTSPCSVVTDQNGQASTFVTPLAAGVATITAQLAPGSYPSAKQVQTTLAVRSLALDLALAPQIAHVAQGATITVQLTARALSNGSPLAGTNINFAVTKGSGVLTAPGAVTDANGYASTNLQLTSIASNVQVMACVAPADLPCVTFYAYAVPSSDVQLEPVSGTSQAVLAGQSFQSVIVRAVDFSVPANAVMGENVVFRSTVERGNTLFPGTSAGDTTITPIPTPIILSSSQTTVSTDANGLAAFQPTTAGFTGAVQVVGTATVGTSSAPFALESLPSPLATR
ncbi:MAG TPA: Ig-like domain-containing protein, partial [Terriglobales bacterium]|nr:Ig-like domain-containing protein [Terriglobales bacterium]